MRMCVYQKVLQQEEQKTMKENDTHIAVLKLPGCPRRGSQGKLNKDWQKIDGWILSLQTWRLTEESRASVMASTSMSRSGPLRGESWGSEIMRWRYNNRRDTIQISKSTQWPSCALYKWVRDPHTESSKKSDKHIGCAQEHEHREGEWAHEAFDRKNGPKSHS